MVVVVGCVGGGGIDASTAHEQTRTDDFGNSALLYSGTDLCIDHCKNAFK